jgi:hypothetical protein
MLLRNVLPALFLCAAPLAAQTAKQQAAPTRHPASSASRAAKTPAPSVSADSARKIVLANMPNAKVRSEHLSRNGGKRAYMFSLTAAGTKHVSRAAVDAETGTFTQMPDRTASATTRHHAAAKTAGDSAKKASPKS